VSIFRRLERLMIVKKVVDVANVNVLIYSFSLTYRLVCDILEIDLAFGGGRLV
jgi:hypothetical protein